MSDAPIFVVGVPRSGTTLLASMLAAHSRLACGPETAYFAELAASESDRRTSSPAELVAFAESTSLEGESLLDRFSIEREELLGRLESIELSPVAVLEVLGELTAARFGKERWVEKSPVHLLYVREIRHWFPLSPIVRIVRDPRDVAMSLTRVPWGPVDLLGGLLYWRRFHERSCAFFGDDPLSYTVSYEGLVADPKTTLRHICSFLGETPEPAMHASERPAAELVRDAEGWKGNVGGAIDSSRIERWRSLSIADQRLADAAAGDLLEELDYPLAGEGEDVGWLWLHPRHEGASNDRALHEALERGLRLWSERGRGPKEGLLVGEPDDDDWLGRGSWERLRAVCRIVLRALALRLRGRPVRWSRGPEPNRAGGLSAGLVSLLLAPLTSRGASDR